MVTFERKIVNINSKILVKEVSDFVEEIIKNFNIIWDSTAQRDVILEVIDEYLQIMAKDNKIEQWNVICDGRNNKRFDPKNKITYLDVEYKQRNCYNITKLKYKITESST